MKATYKIRVRLEPDEEGFHVWVPTLPGCHSWGRTKEEALANIRGAAELYLESMIAHRDPIPLEAHEPSKEPKGEELTLTKKK